MLDLLGPSRGAHEGEIPALRTVLGVVSAPEHTVAARATIVRGVPRGAVRDQAASGADEMGHERPLPPSVPCLPRGTSRGSSRVLPGSGSPRRLSAEGRVGPNKRRVAERGPGRNL